MANKWAIQVIETLNPEELRDLEAFFQGSPDKTSQHALCLFCMLKKETHRDWPDKKLWQAIHKDRPYQEPTLRGYFSILFAALKEFLVHQAFDQDQRYQDLLLLRQLNQRRLYTLFENHYKKTAEQYCDDAPLDDDDFLYGFHRETEYHNHLLQPSRRDLRNNLPGISQAFDKWWVLQKLIIACTERVNQNILGEVGNSIWFQALLEHVDQSPELQCIPLIHIYRKLYDLLRDEASDAHYELCDLLIQYQKVIPPKRLRLVYALVLNAFIARAQRGDTQGLQEVLDVYQWGAQNHLLHMGGYMRAEHYKNYVSVATRIKAFDLAVAFIRTYTRQLAPEVRDELQALCMAMVRFHKGKFAKLRQMLPRIHFATPFFRLSVQNLILQVDYELEYHPQTWGLDREMLQKNINNLIKYLKNNEVLSETRKAPMLNRLRLMARLVNAKTQNALVKLHADIDTTKPLDNPEWLAEKVSERLEKEYGILPGEGENSGE